MIEQNNIYKTPSADLTVEESRDNNYPFFPTSNKKLLVLFFSTLGIYSIYWFYKHWSFQQKYMDKKIIPILRSIFYIFFTHSLFKRIKVAADKKGIKYSLDFSVLATLYIVLEIVSNGLDRASMKTEHIGILDYASIAIIVPIVFPLYVAQRVANRVNDDPEGKLNAMFSMYNYIFITIGILFWILVIVGLLQIDLSYLNQYLNLSIRQ